MDSSRRAELIREGNRAFNAKDFRRARELFTQTGYKDGLVRLGDHYMYEKRLPLLAYGYYKRAGVKAKLEDLHRRMAAAIAEWIGYDKLRPEYQSIFSAHKPIYETDKDGMIPVSVSSTLQRKAQAILNKNKINVSH